jgi:hypothetical protein
MRTRYAPFAHAPSAEHGRRLGLIGRAVTTKDRVCEPDEVTDADQNEPQPPWERSQDVGGVKDREDKRNAYNDRA